MSDISDALARIGGSIYYGSVVYFDDNTRRYYVGPKEDLGRLVRLMDDDDEDMSRDAYSHWCAGVSHGDGYESMEDAITAAKQMPLWRYETDVDRGYIASPSAELALDSLDITPSTIRHNAWGWVESINGGERVTRGIK